MTYFFDAQIAEQFGVDEAIIIQNFQYWIAKNEANKKHYHDGRYWTYNTAEAFTKLFPFWSAGQIRRILKSLQEKEVLITGNFNPSAYDRTMWYAFSDSFISKFQNRNFHLAISQNGDNESARPIPNNKEQIIIADNNREYAQGALFPSEERLKGTAERRVCLFEESRFAALEDFKLAMQKEAEAGIDVEYYYYSVKDWSASKGAKKKDWIATARNFMRGDADAKRLHKIQDDNNANMIQYLKDMAEL